MKEDNTTDHTKAELAKHYHGGTWGYETERRAEVLSGEHKHRNNRQHTLFKAERIIHTITHF
jgi:hypothetical protein